MWMAFAETSLSVDIRNLHLIGVWWHRIMLAFLGCLDPLFELREWCFPSTTTVAFGLFDTNFLTDIYNVHVIKLGSPASHSHSRTYNVKISKTWMIVGGVGLALKYPPGPGFLSSRE